MDSGEEGAGRQGRGWGVKGQRLGRVVGKRVVAECVCVCVCVCVCLCVTQSHDVAPHTVHWICCVLD